MKKRVIIIILALLPNLLYSQQLIWKHTGGPMGGIVGDIDINSSGNIYAGIYPFFVEYSGLYKSTDNGDSWNKIVTQFEDFEVYAIYITKEDHIWVGTNYQGRIYYSSDDGVTWENKRNGYNTGECWAFGQSKDGVLFSGDAENINLYRSTDNGDNWEFSANLSPLVFATDSDNIVYAGTFDGLFATTDNGLTWEQNNFLSNIPVASVLIDSDNNIYCGTGYYDSGNGVYYSIDKGQSWIQLGLSGKVVLSLAFDSQGNLYAGTKQDGLFKTTDNGKNWIQCNEGIFRKEVFRLKTNKQDNIFIGSENEGVFRSINSGNSFEQVGLPTSNLKNICFGSDSLIFASTPSGVQSFNKKTKKWKNSGLQDVYGISISPAGVLYAATFADGLYKSSDLGVNWELTNLTIDTIMSTYNVLAKSDDTVFVATGRNLRKTTDGGNSWYILPVETSFFSRGMFLNNSVLWVTGTTSGNDNVYKSNDYVVFDSTLTYNNGWAENSCISGFDEEFVFVTDPFKGTYRSTNNGISWQQLLSGRGIWSIYSEETGLVIGGAIDTLWYSLNLGNSWVPLSTPLKGKSNVTEIKKDMDNQLYIGTYSEGLFGLDILTNNEKEDVLSNNYYLSQNYPNPFNPKTKISYSVSRLGKVSIIVYDVLGEEVKTLIDETRSTGNYIIDFDGSELSSGIYFYQMKVNDFIETKKMILLK